jgi:hypothetical protein
MISIICTKCRTALTIDEAFAGGVCRCQHCGTIQTVPTHLKNSARPPAPGSPPGSKTLYQRRANSDAGTGLDDLADAVATSSGLGSRRLRSATGTATASDTKAPPQQVQKKTRPRPMLIIGGALIAGMIVLAVIFLMHSSTSSTATQTPGLTPSPTPPEPIAPAPIMGPSFCGVPLDGPSVVYIIDRGSASDPFFDPLKAVLYHSLDLIGPTRKFAVILTENGSANLTFPPTGLVDATPDQTQKARNALDDVVAGGASHFRWAIEQAVARHPAVIVFVTAKWSLPLTDDDAAALMQNAQRGIPIDTFMLGDSNATDALEKTSSRSGGTFRRVTSAQLAQFTP